MGGVVLFVFCLFVVLLVSVPASSVFVLAEGSCFGTPTNVPAVAGQWSVKFFPTDDHTPNQFSGSASLTCFPGYLLVGTDDSWCSGDDTNGEWRPELVFGRYVPIGTCQPMFQICDGRTNTCIGQGTKTQDVRGVLWRFSPASTTPGQAPFVDEFVSESGSCIFTEYLTRSVTMSSQCSCNPSDIHLPCSLMARLRYDSNTQQITDGPFTHVNANCITWDGQHGVLFQECTANNPAQQWQTITQPGSDAFLITIAPGLLLTNDLQVLPQPQVSVREWPNSVPAAAGYWFTADVSDVDNMYGSAYPAVNDFYGGNYRISTIIAGLKYDLSLKSGYTIPWLLQQPIIPHVPAHVFPRPPRPVYPLPTLWRINPGWNDGLSLYVPPTSGDYWIAALAMGAATTSASGSAAWDRAHITVAPYYTARDMSNYQIRCVQGTIMDFKAPNLCRFP